jgi:hypothetical protein
MLRWTIGIAALGSIVLWLACRRWRAKRESMTGADVATIIDHYLHGAGGAWEWGDFVETRFRNPRLEHLRKLCWEAESKLPHERQALLEDLSRRLRSGEFPS